MHALSLMSTQGSAIVYVTDVSPVQWGCRSVSSLVGLRESRRQYAVPIPGRLSQCALTLRAARYGWRVVTDTRRCRYKSPSHHHVCRVRRPCATSCIGPPVPPTLPAWPFPTRSWCRCASRPAPDTSWPAGSTAPSATSGPPPTSRSTGRCAPWRTTAGCTSTSVEQQGRPDKKVYDVTDERPRRAGPLDRRTADRPRQRRHRRPHPRTGREDPRRRVRRRSPRCAPKCWRCARASRAAGHLPGIREAPVPRPVRADRSRHCTSTWCCVAASAPRRARWTGSTKY